MRAKTAGYTLMEVLVSMMIVGVAATATTGGMVFTTNVIGENTMHHDAIVLAQKSVERLRTVSYNDIESGSETSADSTYAITRSVTDDDPEEGMKRITVTVSWQWKGVARSYALDTVFAKITKS
jgi:prepilin-type N-terminal cleavage/methylation domain-containing protein